MTEPVSILPHTRKFEQIMALPNAKAVAESHDVTEFAHSLAEAVLAGSMTLEAVDGAFAILRRTDVDATVSALRDVRKQQ